MYENKTLEKYINEKHRANRLAKEIENYKKTIDRNNRELKLQKELMYHQIDQLIKIREENALLKECIEPYVDQIENQTVKRLVLKNKNK